MTKYAHRKILEDIIRIDTPPDDDIEFSRWTQGGKHLEFLLKNALSDDVVVYASGPYTFIHSLVVPDEALVALDQRDLLAWSDNPYTSIASYVSGGGREEMWIDREASGRGSKILDRGRDLIFVRTFEGWKGQGAQYVEANQEYTHLAGIHWRPEHRAYCKYDHNGDLDELISVSVRNEDGDVSLVSFAWSDLQDYLAIGKCSLVRLFDFMLLRHGAFSGWPDGPEDLHVESDTLFYRQKISPNAAYTRGVQILRPRKSAKAISTAMMDGWKGGSDDRYVEFVAHDFRNGRIARVSTDPSQTTNYFEAEGNNLPFELSPAFFRAEVLSKYKTDRDKYTVGEREISCRAAWHLKGYDVNEAGQIHAYICDLRRLPYTEQLHWLSYNENPRSPISSRAFTNDFEGKFVDFLSPREEVMSTIRRWRDDEVRWWKLRDEGLLERANHPLTASQDEWSEAHMDLSKLIVEGFDPTVIRDALDQEGAASQPGDQSILLLEKLAIARKALAAGGQFAGLRTVQRIRSKVKGHSGSSEAKKIVQDAISRHGSFSENFRQICAIIAGELAIVQALFEGPADA